MHKVCWLMVAVSGLSALSLGAEQARLSGFPKDEAQGWIWYNQPKPRDSDAALSPPATAPISPQNATALKEKLQAATQAAMDKAMLFPSAEHFRKYKLLQDFWVEKASQFAQTSKVALLKYPELDYNVRYSHYNGTAGLRQTMQRQREKAAIAKLSAENGLFYFYRGKESVDVLMGVVVRAFVKEYGISLIAVSVDSTLAPELPDSRPDTGQSTTLGITHFPAIFLVNPQKAVYQPLAYGFHSQEALASQFLLVATDFARDF